MSNCSTCVNFKKGSKVKNYGNKLEIKQVWKQVRQWKQVKDGAQGLLYVE